nr:hypothetical protein [Kitasatospora sp. SID7827]
MLGAVERGRGLGRSLALADRAAGAEAVLDCLRRETRWDRQSDQRHGYHARLLRESAAPVEPVLELLEGADEDTADRVLQTLAELALIGGESARDALRAHVRHGEHWQEALGHLGDRWPVESWDDLRPDALRRLGGAEPACPDDHAWRHWRGPEPERGGRGPHRMVFEPRNGRLLAVLRDPGAARGELSRALGTLASRPGTFPEVLPMITELSTTEPAWLGERALPGVFRIVRRLGPLAVEPAREWAVDSRSWLSGLGLQVLAEHGTVADAPLLLAELARQCAVGQWCGSDGLADGLARFGPAVAEAAPLLRGLWENTPHSYERPSYLRALHAITPDGTDALLHESLWDCESDARLYAVRHAPESRELAHRLARLRDSPAEDDDLRAAAAERLGR